MSINFSITSNINRMFSDRISLGLSRKAVANMAGISTKAIYNYEAGIQLPTRKVYNRLAQIFGWEVWV